MYFICLNLKIYLSLYRLIYIPVGAKCNGLGEAVIIIKIVGILIKNIEKQEL